jgi:anti-anti-sigma regulatory factor
MPTGNASGGPAGFEVRVADRGATSTLTVVGELDLETADELVTVAEAALRRSHRVVIDLSQTDFVGSRTPRRRSSASW